MDGDDELGQDVFLAIYGVVGKETFARMVGGFAGLGLHHMPAPQGHVGVYPLFTGRDQPGLWLDEEKVLERIQSKGLAAVWLPTPRDAFTANPPPALFRRRGASVVRFPAAADWPEEAILAANSGLHIHDESAHARIAMAAFAVDQGWPTWLWPTAEAEVGA